MKKVLLATTALVAFAGAASADVSLSGSARFGLQYNSGALPGAPSVTLEKRTTINIDASTETDSGLELGARIRIRSDEAAGTAVNGSNVYLKSGGFKLNVGNICGAIECMPGVYGGSVGLNGNGWHNLVTNTFARGYWTWDAYSSRGNGATGIEITYSAGDFSGHLSHSTLNNTTVGVFSLDLIAGYVAYSFGDWQVALAAQQGLKSTPAVANAFDKVVFTVTGSFGDFGVGLAIADNDGFKKGTVHASYTMGATTLSAFVADERTAGVGTSAGIQAAYDIGGATLVGGVSRVAMPADTNATVASAGIKFSF